MKRPFKASNSESKPTKTIKHSPAKTVQTSKVLVGDIIRTSPKIVQKKHKSISIKAFYAWLGMHWRGVLSAFIIAILAILTLSLGLDTLVKGQNIYETETLNNLQNMPIPWRDAVNLPYNIPAYTIGYLLDDPLLGARVTSAIYGLLSIALMFYILKRWFNIRIATVGSLLFMTSSWLLHITHMATPIVLLIFGPLLLLAAHSWFHRTKKYKFLAFMSLTLSLALTAYISYMPWMILVILGVVFILEKRNLQKLTKKQLTISAFVSLLFTIPLILSLLYKPSQFHLLLGIPQQLPSIHDYFAQLLYTISMLIFRSAPMPSLHLATLPMLDIFSAAMLFMGIYYFALRIKSHHSIAIFASLVLYILLIPLSPVYQLSATILLSFIYVCVIAGIVELLNQWFTYFPRNPWARNFGVAMIVIAIGIASLYHLQRYFVAWPNAPETKNSYSVVAQNLVTPSGSNQ